MKQDNDSSFVDARRRRLLALAAVACGTLLDLPVRAFAAGPYPNHAVRLICPFAAGGSADVVARLVAEQLTRRLGRAVVVENRTGAGGNIGTQVVVSAPPDGYTLLLGYDGTLVINPHIYRKMSFDPLTDVEPVGLIGTVPLLVLANPSVNAKTMNALIALTKSSPNGFAYGTPGIGSTQQLMFELIEQSTGAKFEHVPYRGAAPAMVDALGGSIPLVGAALAGSIEYIRSGKLRALAISSAERSHYLPDVPTLEECGMKGLVINTWHAILVPARTPRAIVNVLNAKLDAALQDPLVRQRLDAVGSIAAPGTPEQLSELMKSDFTRNGMLVKRAHIAPVD